MEPTSVLPVIAGTAVFAGLSVTGLAVTAAVAIEVEDAEPKLLVAVTVTVIVLPTSSSVKV